MAKEVTNKEELIDEEIIYEEESGEGAAEQKSGDSKPGLLNNRRFLTIGLVVVLAGVLGWVYWRNQKLAQNEEGREAMIDATYAYERDSLIRAVNGGPGGVPPGFSELVSTYSGTNVGNLSHYYLGTAYLRQGKLDEAIQYLEDFKKGKDFVSAMAYSALGNAYEDKGEFATAASYYEKAANTPEENSKTSPTFLMDAARAYESAGDAATALKTYRKVYEKFPQSTQGMASLKEIGRLDANSDGSEF